MRGTRLHPGTPGEGLQVASRFQVEVEIIDGAPRHLLRGLSQTLGMTDYGPQDLLHVCRAVRTYLTSLFGSVEAHDGVGRIPLIRCRSPAAMAFFKDQVKKLVANHRSHRMTSMDVQMLLRALSELPDPDAASLLLPLHTVRLQ